MSWDGHLDGFAPLSLTEILVKVVQLVSLCPTGIKRTKWSVYQELQSYTYFYVSL
jgi:hypothetical protein